MTNHTMDTGHKSAVLMGTEAAMGKSRALFEYLTEVGSLECAGRLEGVMLALRKVWEADGDVGAAVRQVSSMAADAASLRRELASERKAREGAERSAAFWEERTKELARDVECLRYEYDRLVRIHSKLVEANNQPSIYRLLPRGEAYTSRLGLVK